MIAYSGDPPKCECCGESHIEFLTIDHINGDGAKERREMKAAGLNAAKGGHEFYCLLEKRGFPAGYRVLCFNCNCARGFFGECPHERLRKSG
jgi:hypothetical protein